MAVLIICCKLHHVDEFPIHFKASGRFVQQEFDLWIECVHTCEHYITCSLVLVWMYTYIIKFDDSTLFRFCGMRCDSICATLNENTVALQKLILNMVEFSFNPCTFSKDLNKKKLK